jgi:hypothetical protein
MLPEVADRLSGRRPDMGYFDVLTVGCFKTAQDERKLFFPWGILGRGYIIPSAAAAANQNLRRRWAGGGRRGGVAGELPR